MAHFPPGDHAVGTDVLPPASGVTSERMAARMPGRRCSPGASRMRSCPPWRTSRAEQDPARGGDHRLAAADPVAIDQLAAVDELDEHCGEAARERAGGKVQSWHRDRLAAVCQPIPARRQPARS
jgi:hypothetical protein